MSDLEILTVADYGRGDAGYNIEGAYVGTDEEQNALLWHEWLGEPELANEIGLMLRQYAEAQAEIEFNPSAAGRMAEANAALRLLFARAAKLALN